MTGVLTRSLASRSFSPSHGPEVLDPVEFVRGSADETGQGSSGWCGFGSRREKAGRGPIANVDWMLIGFRFPLDLTEVGLPPIARFGSVAVWRGLSGWQWEGTAPDLPIEVVVAPPSVEAEGWGVDHVVVTTPDLDATVGALQSAGAEFRRAGEARGRRASFLVAGPLIEVVEVDRARTLLWGLALETDEPLEAVATAWTAAGWNLSDPHDAVQPGRRIMSVLGTPLAVMTRRPST